MRRQLFLSATAAAAVALLCCTCVGSAARDCGRPVLTAELQQRLLNYSETSEGVRYCEAVGRTTHNDAEAELSFTFDMPGLDLMWCEAEQVVAAEGGGAYVVLLGVAGDSTARFKCVVCDTRWYQLDPHRIEQRVVFRGSGLCGIQYLQAPLLPEGHPAGPGARLDGIRCYSAFRKGCGGGYGWCRGNCCRMEALFYYPQLQKPIGSGELLTAQNAGPREAPLLKLLQKAPKENVADC